MSTTVHSPTAQTNRALSQARGLLARLDGMGIPRTDAYQQATDRATSVNRLSATLRKDHGALDGQILSATLEADQEALVALIQQRSALADALEAAQSDTIVSRLAQQEVAAIYAAANDSQAEVIEAFNSAGLRFTDTLHDRFNGGPVIPADVLNSGASKHWSALTGAAEDMTSAAAVLETLDGIDPGEAIPETRYARNLAYPGAADRSYTGGTPSMLRADLDSVRVGEDPTRRRANGWDWLDDPALTGMVRWLELATGEARPDARIELRYDPAQQDRDDAAFRQMLKEFPGTQHMHISQYAPEFWAQRS